MKKKRLLAFTGYLVLIVGMLLIRLVFEGRSLTAFTFNPAAKVGELASEGKIVKGFSNEEFQIYYVDSGEEVTPYAFIKRFGIWICDYPHDKNIIGITYGKDNIYYYGRFASDGKYDFIEDPNGVKIYADKTELGRNTTSVYQIPYNKHNKKDSVVYRFVDMENLINEQTLFLEGDVSLYKRENEKEVILESTIGQLKQEQAQLWAFIEETIKSADKSVEIPDGRVYKSDKRGDVIWQIYVRYETGHFINVEQGKRCYDWAGSAYYDIELKGQHPNTLAVRFDDYAKTSMFEELFSKSHVYPTTIPKGLEKYFEEL
jgi:hypothetical protein